MILSTLRLFSNPFSVISSPLLAASTLLLQLAASTFLLAASTLLLLLAASTFLLLLAASTFPLAASTLLLAACMVSAVRLGFGSEAA